MDCWLDPVAVPIYVRRVSLLLLTGCLLTTLGCSSSGSGLAGADGGEEEGPGGRRQGGSPSSTTGEGGDASGPSADARTATSDSAAAAVLVDGAPVTDAARPVADGPAPDAPMAPTADASATEPPLVCAAGTADCNGNRADGCEARLDGDDNCGACGRRCGGATPVCQGVAGGAACQNPAAALDGQRWESPCGAPSNNGELCEDLPKGGACPTPDGVRPVAKSLKMAGRPGTIYELKLRFRGVVEPRIYGGGTSQGDHFYVGGLPRISTYNVYSLTVSAPAQVYYLNSDEGKGETRYVFPLDHVKTIRVEGGATVKLDATDTDCALVRNCMDVTAAMCKPYVVAGVSPAPAGYNGQFIQMDLVSVMVAGR